MKLSLKGKPLHSVPAWALLRTLLERVAHQQQRRQRGINSSKGSSWRRNKVCSEYRVHFVLRVLSTAVVLVAEVVRVLAVCEQYN